MKQIHLIIFLLLILINMLTACSSSSSEESAQVINTIPAARAAEINYTNLSLQQLTKLADENDLQAQVYLGSLYFTGSKTLKADPIRAFFWTKKAAEQNHTGAEFGLGLMYQKGLGTKKDSDEAMVWYQKAAEKNHVKAQYSLGLLYEQKENNQRLQAC